MEQINKGALANDKTGTPARQAADIINNNFAYLNGKISNIDEILVQTGWVLVGQDLTLNAGWEWIIAGINYTNPVSVLTNIPFAASGLKRLDTFVLNQSNTLSRIAGVESVNPLKAPRPANTIEAFIVLVSDDIVGEPSNPVIGDSYVKKIESQDYVFNSVTAVIDKIDLIDERSSISLTGSITDVKSVQVSTNFIRPGKPFFIKNKTGHNVKLWQLAGTGNVKFSMSNGVDLVVKNKEVILFNLNANDSSAVVLEYVGNVPVDVSGKEDSVNKSNLLTDADSSVKFPTWSAITLWVKEKLIAALSSKATPIDTDVFLIGDNSDSGKTKKFSFANLIVWLSAIFQTKDEQIEVLTNSNISNAWNGKTILITASCTITVPPTLNNQLSFPLIIYPGVTVTWAITSPFTWIVTPTPITAGSDLIFGMFVRKLNTNSVSLNVG